MIIKFENRHGVKVRVESSTVESVEAVSENETRLHIGLEGATIPLVVKGGAEAVATVLGEARAAEEKAKEEGPKT